MAEMLYRTSLSLPGPWLIDLKDLESLDTLIDDEVRRLSEISKRELDNELQREINKLRKGSYYQEKNPERKS
jgi:hypothetical protein